MALTPRDGLHAGRYRVLALYGAWNAVMQFEWLRLAPVTDDAAAQLQVAASDIGVLSLLFPLLFVVLALPAGWLLDKLSVRAALHLCATLMLVGAAIRTLSVPSISSYTLILIGQTLFALAQPLIMAMLSRLVLVWFPPAQQLAATGVGTATLFLGVGLAFVLVPMTAQHVAPSLDWDPRALLPLTVLTFLLVPRDPPAIHPPNESAPATKWLTAVGRLLKTPPCAALLALIFLGNGYFNAIFTWLEPLLAPRGFDAAQAGWVGLVMLCGGLAGMALASTLPVLVKHLRLAITTAALLAIPLTLGLIGARMPTAIYSVSFALGILMLAPLPLLIDRMTHTAGPGRAGTALSLFWLSGNAGAAAAIAALSPIADGGAWWIGGGLLAAMLLLEAVVTVIGLRKPSTTSMTLD